MRKEIVKAIGNEVAELCETLEYTLSRKLETASDYRTRATTESETERRYNWSSTRQAIESEASAAVIAGILEALTANVMGDLMKSLRNWKPTEIKYVDSGSVENDE